VGGSGSQLQAYVNLGNGSAWFGGPLTLGGTLAVGGAITPSVGNSENNGILFPKDPGGGTGDRAFIRYYVDSGETTRLVIGNSNNPDDRVSIYQNGAECLTVYNGCVGINWTTPGTALHVNGTIWSSGLSVDGPIAGRTKNFCIDHPLDAERSLVHSVLEGPEVAVFYRGEAMLVDGACEVVLPSYFEALTRTENRTVLVTPKLSDGEETSALAASGVADGQFMVRAIDRRNRKQRFFWEVKGVRADVDPLDVEPMKPGVSALLGSHHRRTRHPKWGRREAVSEFLTFWMTNMATKNRSELKGYFARNAIPTEGNYADLIDSQLNQAQDGVFKPDGDALSVVAAPGDPKRALRLYASYPAANPDWMISLNPAQDPANAATICRPGFGITDGAGRTRLFIDAATGQIGVGTNAPQVALDVAGTAQANGFRGRYDAMLSDYRTPNPASNVCLQAPASDRDAWIYRDPGDSANNWGIYHRQIDTPVGSLPGNSIGFVGGTDSQLQAYVNLADGSGFFAGGLSVQRSLNVNASSTSSYLLRLNDAQGGSLVYVSTDGSMGIGSGVTPAFKLDVRGYSRFTDPQGRYNCHLPNGDNKVYLSGENIYLRGGSPTNSNVILTATASDNSVTITGNLATTGQLPTSGWPSGWHGVNIWDVVAHGAMWAVAGYRSGSIDVAEKFALHEDGLEPGDVVIVDPERPERLIRLVPGTRICSASSPRNRDSSWA
jgi:hypothetical protein